MMSLAGRVRQLSGRIHIYKVVTRTNQRYSKLEALSR